MICPCLPAAGLLPEIPPTTLVLGNPVQLVNVPLEGVPNTGVVKEGDVAPTNDPLPVMAAANAVATPVPNEAIELIGNPVQLVRVPLEGVPNTGVVKDGDVAPTNDPLPVMAAANAVATPVPNDAIELIGSPVQFVNVPLEGVPNTGVVKDGDVAPTNDPLPVMFAASAVATPVPRPVMAPTGNPVQLVNVPLEGVPNTGVVKEGDVAPTNDPLPVMFAANAVATPVPNDAIELIGNPVQLVNVPLDGVPNVGEIKVGPVDPTNAPLPENAPANAVATPVPNPVILLIPGYWYVI